MEGNEPSECTICGVLMRSQRAATYKVSACCGTLRSMHIPCAKKYHLKLFPNPATPLFPDPTNPFSLKTWTSKPSIKMFCFKCRFNCLFCKTGHYLSNDNIAFIQCTTKKCTSWSYYMPPSLQNVGGCISKSDKEIDTAICEKCQSAIDEDNEEEYAPKLRQTSKAGTFDEISQISLVSNSLHHREIYDTMYSFKTEGSAFINTFKQYQDCDDYLTLHFSHLDPALNNIFKPNNPVGKGLDGLYLTVDSLKRLICSISNGWLNDTIFSQMSDLMNFYEEFDTSTGVAGLLLPNILFGDGYVEQIDLNPNHIKVNDQFALINGDVPANMKGVNKNKLLSLV